MPLPGPDTRVVELRVPGLTGTSGESLLDAIHTVDVAGDGRGQLIRPSDRLRRPAPGPVIQALGRSVPRTLEGYLWRKMTSGGAAKATWALLFPFSLANVAHWMLPPAPAGSNLGTALTAVCQALLRVAALLLTMLLVTQLAVVSLDLLAVQCLAPGSGCLPTAPSWLSELDFVRTTIGILPLLVLIYVLHRVSSTNWTINADETRPRPHATPLPGESLHARHETPLLRVTHTVAALASVALLPLGGPFRVPAGAVDVAAWACAVALLGLAVLTAALLGVPGLRAASMRPSVRWGCRAVLSLAVLLVVVVAVHATPLPANLTAADNTPLAGTNGTVEGIGAALVMICVLFALLLIPVAWLSRPTWRALPKRLRPWVGGWAAAPVLALAGLLGGGFGAGLAIALRQLVRANELRLPETYRLITVLWGVGLVFAAVLGLLGFAVAVPLRRRVRGVPAAVRMLQTDLAEEKAAATAWARAAWERRHLHHIVLAVAVSMSAGAGLLLVVRYGLHTLPGWVDPFAGLGVLALGVLAAGLLRVVYTAAKSPEHSRHLGALADLVCLWPRGAHPAVPPCYALKVVPELVARAKSYLEEPQTRVVLSGHNLGGLLAVVAAARLADQLPEADRERVGLVTAGSPLQWGYQRAFPAVLPYAGLARLYGMLDGRWRGLCRNTDTFGGGVTTWRHQVVGDNFLGVGYLSDGSVGPLPAAVPGPTGALVLGGDHWLPDPMRGPYNGRRWTAGVRRGHDYLADPEWDRAVAVAAGLQRADKPARSAGEQVPLFPDLAGRDRLRARSNSSQQ